MAPPRKATLRYETHFNVYMLDITFWQGKCQGHIIEAMYSRRPPMGRLTLNPFKPLTPSTSLPTQATNAMPGYRNSW